MSSSGHRALGALIAKYKLLNGMGFDTYSKCYETSVCPVIDYGGEVLGYLKSQKLDTVQNKAMRVFLGVHRFAANAAVSGDMGWYPGIIRRKIRMLRYWNRLTTLPDDRITRTVFVYDIEKGGKWSQSIKRILREIDQVQLFENKVQIDLKEAKELLMENFKLSWEKLVTKKPKLRTYKQFKTKCETDKYVTLNLERNQRSVLAQLRAGILHLQIELGRFTNIK